jgi:hypothetical protein
MRRQAANLRIQILHLALVGGLPFRHRLRFSKTSASPVTAASFHARNTVLATPYSDASGLSGLVSGKSSPPGLGLEGCRVRLFHRLMLPNPRPSDGAVRSACQRDVHLRYTLVWRQASPRFCVRIGLFFVFLDGLIEG